MGHLDFGFGGFVALTGEVQDAVDEDTEQLVVEGRGDHLGIRADSIQGDEDVAVERGGSGVVKGDDIRVVVMPKELSVHL